MIYSVYFQALLGVFTRSTFASSKPTAGEARLEGKNKRQALANIIKKSKGDKFVFITVKAQENDWNNFIEANGLKDYISYEMPDFVTNGNHTSYGRNLKLRVLTSKD